MVVGVSPGSQSVLSGGTATFTVTVINTGGGYVYGGSVSAPNAPNCNHALESPAEPGLLPPNGYTLTYTCSVSGVSASFTNVVTASGQSQNGDRIAASGSAQVSVIAAQAPSLPPPPPPPPPPVHGKTITGTAHGDHLTGTGGNDLIKGLGGNDVLNGEKGDDTILGGAGNDRITGGPGKDTLSGGPGNDTISAADGARDTIDCGPGTDSVTADKTDQVAKNCERVHRSSSL
jgi:Ca2+-binding RTX toxin-like protein